MSEELVRIGDDGVARCWWAGTADDYIAYHDDEWGRPVLDDTRLFEKLCLEGFQSGLSWLTILRKRENFRAAFAGFDIPTVAGFGAHDVERLLGDAGIVRHRGKIRSTINNAGRALELIAARVRARCGSPTARACVPSCWPTSWERPSKRLIGRRGARRWTARASSGASIPSSRGDSPADSSLVAAAGSS